MTTQLHHGDCLEIMPTLADNSVDLILTDPPYFKVKGDAWDRQWDKPAGFLAWLDTVLVEYHRILKPNGSMYLFASPQMSARVEMLIAERFEVLNRITWAKPEPTCEINKGAGNGGRVSKDALRKYYPNTESCIFAEHIGAESYAKGEAGYGAKCDELRGFVFEPLRDYIVDEFKASGIDKIQFNVICGFSASSGGMASRHYLSASQWCLPTAEHYASLAAATGQFNRPYEELRKEYEELRKEYEELRRPFNATPDKPYTDVWTYKTVQAYKGKHPCEKPQQMIEDMIEASTRPNAVVFDSFMGGGTTGAACVETDRNFIGIEKDDAYFEIAKERIDKAGSQLALAV